MRARSLGELAESLGSLESGPEETASSARVVGITTNSGEVEPGTLFVAIRGTRTDGHAFLEEAVRRGAAGVVVDSAYEGDLDAPVIRVPDTRKAVAELAAAWHGRPAERVRMVGITGSLGKTSILSMIEAILTESDTRVGAVGSLGVHVDGETRTETGHTAPDPLSLHRELRRLADEGCEVVAMEVTSHALVQDRVHGLRYDLGVFSNLVPLEHSEYHETFREYAQAKSRFFDHLVPCAPLVYNVDSQAVRRLVRDSEATPIGCGTGRAALARIHTGPVDTHGSRFELDVRRALPRLDGGEVEPLRLPLELRLLGRSNVANAALAATTALVLGADPAAIRGALAGLPRQPRRLQIVHHGRFTILDDTVGHPDSISAMFEVVERFAPRRVHLAFAIRGQRGARVNRSSATTLAIWARRIPLETLVVTSSTDAADERNRVGDEERDAFEGALREHGVAYRSSERLEDAVTDVLEAADDGDLVLLLGAQGMDDGQRIAREWLRARGETEHAAVEGEAAPA